MHPCALIEMTYDDVAHSLFTWLYTKAALAGRVDAAQAEKWERALSELRKVRLREFHCDVAFRVIHRIASPRLLS
jgi:hypothetical protein